jgi:hypothetical protein
MIELHLESDNRTYRKGLLASQLATEVEDEMDVTIIIAVSRFMELFTAAVLADISYNIIASILYDAGRFGLVVFSTTAIFRGDTPAY